MLCAGELQVGGVYVKRFMKDPRFPLRDPKRFSEALAEAYLAQLGLAGGTTTAAAAATAAAATTAAAASAPSSADTALLLSAAAVALLRGHALLADHLAQLGVTQRLLAALASRTGGGSAAAARAPPPRASNPLGAADEGGGGAAAAGQLPVAPDELGGSVLRLLHQLATSSAACEAMAACAAAPAVPGLARAMVLWGAGAAALVLETLKRLLAGAGRQREALAAQALGCGLPARLLGMLDWHSGAGGAGGGEGAPGGGAGPARDAQDGEGAVLRALAVDVLRALAAGAGEGGGVGYSAKVAALLEASPVWAAYRDQRHDMFLPSGASAGGGVVGLLTGGEAARFALPPAALEGQPPAG